MSVENSCQFINWYKFKKCVVGSCKNYSLKVPSRCIAIDRKPPEGNKIISDEELRFFKFKDNEMCTRLVSLKRKKAVQRIKCMLILKEFIEFIRDNRSVLNVDLSPRHIEWEREYPLKIRMLGFQRWMWGYLLDEEEYKEFTKGKAGECKEVELYEILAMTRAQFDKLKGETQWKHNSST